MPEIVRAKRFRILLIASATLALLFLLSSLTTDSFAQVKRGKRFSNEGNCLDCHQLDKFKGSSGTNLLRTRTAFPATSHTDSLACFASRKMAPHSAIFVTTRQIWV